MSSSIASELAHRLAQDAEAVCRHYLSNGRRHGRYWIVGDARNAPGRSLFVRLTGPESGKGAAGNWTDAALGDYGDLLDIIRQSVGLNDFSEVLDEAALPKPAPRRTTAPASIQLHGAKDRLAGLSAPSIRYVAADRGHVGGALSASSRDFSATGSRKSTIPSTLLLSTGKRIGL